MMNDIKVFPIGKIESNEETVRIVLDKKYAKRCQVCRYQALRVEFRQSD